MLFVQFEIDGARYVLEASRIAEVLPLVQITRVPEAPRGVAGVFNYRGSPVPVVDLSVLLAGRAAIARFSTRLLLVQCPGERDTTRVLAVIAEHATGTLQRGAADFVASRVPSGAEYIGPVATDAHGLIHWIDPVRLLPASVHDALCQTERER